MRNPRITHKELSLLKGKINSVFSRSELRKKVLESGIVEHHDPARPRVKVWVQCNECKKPEAKSYIEVDHKSPKVPVHTNFLDFYQSMDDYIDACWCSEDNLQNLCPECHEVKSQAENKLRRAAAKQKKLKLAA